MPQGIEYLKTFFQNNTSKEDVAMKDSTINHHSAGAPDTSTMPEGAAATTCGVQMRYMGMLLEQESLLTETEL